LRFPQVEAYVRTMKGAMSLANGTKVFDEKNALYADADFFSVFSFPLLRGNAEKVLDAPRKIVLTQKAAKKYFGTEDPIGKTLRMNGSADYEVMGIAGDAPLNSQIQYDVIISFGSISGAERERWTEANYVTYLLVKDATQIRPLAQQLKQ